MNLYKFHSDPDQLDYYASALDSIPEFAWDAFENDSSKLRARSELFAAHAEYAYKYALNVLSMPFPAGEAAIAQNGQYAYLYARDLLKKEWLSGEAAIAQDAYYALRYSMDVLQKPFPAGEAAIAQNGQYAYLYARHVLGGPFHEYEKTIDWAQPSSHGTWEHEYKKFLALRK